MSADNSQAGDEPPTGLKVAPGTEAEELPLLDVGDTTVNWYVATPDLANKITVGASAWDAQDIGIGGVSIGLSILEAEQLRDELTAALEECR